MGPSLNWVSTLSNNQSGSQSVERIKCGARGLPLLFKEYESLSSIVRLETAAVIQCNMLMVMPMMMIIIGVVGGGGGCFN